MFNRESIEWEMVLPDVPDTYTCPCANIDSLDAILGRPRRKDPGPSVQPTNLYPAYDLSELELPDGLASYILRCR